MSKFKQAADYIETHGWVRGKLEDQRTGAVCALGALQAVHKLLGKTVDDDSGPIVRHRYKKFIEDQTRLEEYLETHKNSFSIPYFNDRLATTKEEVIEVLRAAA